MAFVCVLESHNVIRIWYDMHFMYKYDNMYIAHFNCSLSNPVIAFCKTIFCNISRMSNSSHLHHRMKIHCYIALNGVYQNFIFIKAVPYLHGWCFFIKIYQATKEYSIIVLGQSGFSNPHCCTNFCYVIVHLYEQMWLSYITLLYDMVIRYNSDNVGCWICLS